MLLAIDTATRWTGLAIHDGRQIVAEAGWHSANTQTVELAPAVAALLRRTDIDAADLAAVAVAIGPGSYTGLRIGLGLAKGIALANQIRLIGVPTLDILAASLPPADGQLVAVAEAGRSRVWAGRYQWQGRGWQPSGQPVIDGWEALLSTIDGPALFAGEISPAGAKLIRQSEKSFRLATPASSVRRAGFLAELGWLRLRRGRTDDPDRLAPIYLRDPAGQTIATS
jgi:tRNA threonylcarbamoyladenosine biosynthesis protein TsaB